MATIAPDDVEIVHARRNGRHALAYLGHLLHHDSGERRAHDGEVEIGLLHLEIRLVLLNGGRGQVDLGFGGVERVLRNHLAL